MATVEIIIPVYNRPAMVVEAIDSALAAAAEVPIEIIVVDDASTDKTWDRLREYSDPRIRCFRVDANGGQSAARNFGLDRARGDYIKFLDSDDVLVPGHLPAELRAIQETGADRRLGLGCRFERTDHDVRRTGLPYDRRRHSGRRRCPDISGALRSAAGVAVGPGTAEARRLGLLLPSRPRRERDHDRRRIRVRHA